MNEKLQRHPIIMDSDVMLVRGVGFEPTKAFAIGASWAIGTDPPRHSVLPL